MCLFLTIKAVNKDIKCERKFIDKHVHKFLRHFDG